MRIAPRLKVSDRLYQAEFLGAGYDTLEESASVFIYQFTWDWLDAAKEYARRKNKGDNQAYTTVLGGLEFQIKPHGGDGVAFLLSNDLFTIAIRPAEVDFNLSVTYRACTLWQYGVYEARRMIWQALLSEMKPRPLAPRENPDAQPVWRKITRVDYAFDFRSRDFSAEISPEMVSQVVCHAEVLKQLVPKVLNEYGEEVNNLNCELYVRGVRTQTITIGKGAPLEIQIYNKSDEITQKSSKTWMYKIWQQSGYAPDSDGRYRDVWRIEVRFSRPHLAARNIEDFEYFEHHRESLISEALTTRRLCDVADDSNRRRWPVHPLWGAALQRAGQRQEFRPIGRQSERAGEIVVQEAVLDTEAALRRIMVIRDLDKGQILKMMEQIVEELDSTEKHAEAMERYSERYKYLDHAR